MSFWVKNPVFGSKSLEKFGKISEKVQKSLETGFSKHSEIFEILEIVLFQKLQKNVVKLELRKLQKNSFLLENRLESSVKSSQCRALLWSSSYTCLCFKTLRLLCAALLNLVSPATTFVHKPTLGTTLPHLRNPKYYLQWLASWYIERTCFSFTFFLNFSWHILIPFPFTFRRVI